jgi:hypothetical protein
LNALSYPGADRAARAWRDNGAAPGDQRARTQGRMDNREPIDVPFLILVIIVTILVVALGVVLFPHP